VVHAAWLDLFAGLGGVDEALEAVGVPYASIEWDGDIADLSRAAGHPCVTGDVRDPDVIAQAVYKLGRVPTHVWASSPCQAWSAAGKRLGAKDERNGWPWTWQAVDWLRATWGPEAARVLVCENVRGMLHHKKKAKCGRGKDPKPDTCPGCYWQEVVLPQMQARFKHVSWQVLNAADYGVPQHRRRVILICSDTPVAHPTPTHSGAALHAAQADGSYWRRHGLEPREPVVKPEGDPGLLPWRTVRDALGVGIGLKPVRGSGMATVSGERRTHPPDEPAPTVPAATGTRFQAVAAGPFLRPEQVGGAPSSADAPTPPVTTAGNPYLHDQNPGTRRKGDVLPSRAGSEPERLDQPSPTVTTTEAKGTRGKHMWRPMTSGASRRGVPDRASDAAWLATGVRRLTPRECATLQGFRDDFPLDQARTKAVAYKAVGNANPPGLSEAIIRAVLEQTL